MYDRWMWDFNDCMNRIRSIDIKGEFINQIYNKAKTFNPSQKYIFGQCKSFYGQNMFLNDDNQSNNNTNNNNNTLEIIEKNWLNEQKMNYPTFDLPKSNDNDYNLVQTFNSPTLNSEKQFDYSENNNFKQNNYNTNDSERSRCCFL